jgi:hypothetical protein
MMIGPGRLETVRKQFDRRRSFPVPYQKAGCRCTESTHHPKNIFHSLLLFVSVSGLPGTTAVLAGWMRHGSDVLLVCEWGFEVGAGTATLWDMDSVRFGRALGIGARLAAKTMVSAVDAATAPNPSAGKAKQGTGSGPATGSSSTTGEKTQASGTQLGQNVVRTTAQVRQTGRGLKEGGKRFGEAVWGPFVKLSGALWLELTGVFFGIFAVSAGANAWKMRWALHETAANHDAHVRLLISVAMAAAFGYFCLSSFVKASRRVRRR